MRRAPRSGFTIASILLLTIVVAIILAAIRTLEVGPRTIRPDELKARTAAGLCLGVLAGLIVGLRQPKPRRGALLGVMLGALTGALAGLSLAEPRNLPLAAVGAAILLIFGVVCRHYSHHPPGR